MKLTTLCYLERDDRYLMLHRIKKKQDVNKGKWIGVGGKFEFGESPDDCVVREVREETGYTLTDYRLRGIISFLFNEEEAEYIFLYTAKGFLGEPTECTEGTLSWIRKSEIDSLNLWEGDRIFLELIKDEAREVFSLKLCYRDDRLTKVILDGKPLELLEVLSETGEPTGIARERTLVHLRGDFHRTAHVWVVRKREDNGYDLLLQKRSSRKDSFAGCYDISSAGHVPAGDSFLCSAIRELKEELGISAEENELEFVGYHEAEYNGEFYGRPFLNHEKSAVYIYRHPVKLEELTLQRDEVESVRWMEIESVLSAAQDKAPGFCLFEDEIRMLIEGLKEQKG